MMINSKVLTLLLCVVAQAVFGQDDGQCNCEEVSNAHQKCVNDWSALDAIRQTLEQQVRDVESQSNERCQATIEQVRGESQAQLEQTRGEVLAQLEQVQNEGRSQLELVRSESQRELNAVRTEEQTKVEEIQNQAKAELTQCQSQSQELNAQFEQQGSTHRQLQESSRQLEETLATVKSEKSKLEKSVSEKDLTLSKIEKEKKETRRELDDVKKLLDEMIAAKGIVTVDYDLLNERIEEYKAKAQALANDFMGVVGEHLEMVKGKMLEFYKYLETEVYPQVKQTIDKDVIPFVKSTWKQANDTWEEIYSPYRPQVNAQIKSAKTEWNKFYKQNLEPSVKEYELDVHAATAKKTAEDYMTLAHNNLVDGIKSGTGIALNFVKLEEGPAFAVETLEKLHTNHEAVAFYIECFFAFLVGYYLLKWLFFGKKKKKKRTKQQWKEEEAKRAAKGKQQPNNKQQPQGNKKNAKNGHKNTKKNK